MRTLLSWLLLCASSYSVTNYVDQASLTPTSPYTTWETAATTIEDAVIAALPSNTVVVADGHYTLSNTIILPEYCRMGSVHGPAATYIQDAPEEVYISLSKNAHMSGFSVSGFEDDYAIDGARDDGSSISNCVLFANNGGARYVTAYDCIVSNNWGLGMSSSSAYDCSIVNNYNGGIWGGLEGVISNCVIRGNIVHTGYWRYQEYYYLQGAGVAGGTAYDCVIEHNMNLVSDGGGLSETAAYNCVIRGNSAMGNGGGIHQGSAYNCLIEDNYSGGFGGGVYLAEESQLGTVVGCTFINNLSEQNGHALYAFATPPSSGYNPIRYSYFAQNCIFWEDGNQSNASMFGGITCISFSSSINLRHGVLGNVTNRPGFVSFDTGDYRLTPDSACVNAGQNYPDRGLVDLDGYPRTVSGTVDMGAYELQTPTSAGPMSLRAVLEYSPDHATWLSSGEGVDWVVPTHGSNGFYRARVER